MDLRNLPFANPGSAGGPPAPPIDIGPGSPDPASLARFVRRPASQHLGISAFPHQRPRRVHDPNRAGFNSMTIGDKTSARAAFAPGSAGGPPAPPIDIGPGSPDPARLARFVRRPAFQHLSISASRHFPNHPTHYSLLATRYSLLPPDSAFDAKRLRLNRLTRRSNPRRDSISALDNGPTLIEITAEVSKNDCS